MWVCVTNFYHFLFVWIKNVLTVTGSFECVYIILFCCPDLGLHVLYLSSQLLSCCCFLCCFLFCVQVCMDMNTRLHKIYWNIVVTLKVLSYFLLYLVRISYLIYFKETTKDLILFLNIAIIIFFLTCCGSYCVTSYSEFYHWSCIVIHFLNVNDTCILYSDFIEFYWYITQSISCAITTPVTVLIIFLFLMNFQKCRRTIQKEVF